MKFTSAQTLRVWGCEGKEDRDDGGRLSVLAWVSWQKVPFAAREKEMLHGCLWRGETAGSVSDKLSLRVSQGNPETEILNELLKIRDWGSREKNGVETHLHTSHIQGTGKF